MDTDCNQPEYALRIVPAAPWSPKRDPPMPPESLEVLIVAILIVLRVDNSHARGKVSGTDNVHTDAEVTSRELGRELVR